MNPGVAKDVPYGTTTPNRGDVMFVWQAHEGAVTSLAFVPGGGLLSTGVDGVLKYWDPASGSLLYHWKLADTVEQPADSALLRAVPDSSGRFAAVATRGKVQCFDLLDYKVAAEYRLEQVGDLAPAPDRKSFFVVGLWRHPARSMREFVRVHQCDFEGNLIASSQPGRGVTVGVPLAIRPDGTELVAGQTRFRWPDGTKGEHGIWGGSTQYAVSGDGDKLFGMSGNRLVVWGFQLGMMRHRLKGHVAPITALTTTPDGRTLWTASADASVRQWDIDTYKCEKWYGLKIGPLGCVAVSPDGLTGAAGSSLRGSIAMWDLG